MRTGFLLLPVLLSCLLASPALAIDPPPWSDPGDLPIPPDAASVAAIQDEVPVLLAPSASAQRRGVLAARALLPFFAMKRGPGCAGRWLNVGPLAWVCQDRMQFDRAAPRAANDLVVRDTPSGLPFDYYFVSNDGARGYSRLRSVDSGSPDQDLERGFAVAVVEQREFQGDLYGLTRHGMWIAMRDLVPVKPPTFHGEKLDTGRLDLAWVVNDSAFVLSKPAAQARTSRRLVRYQLLRVLEEREVSKLKYFRIDEAGWVSSKDVRKPSSAPRPAEVAEHERWIDVEVATQTLVAYEGDTPLYATLVSTGRPAVPTPMGVHRIWIKLVASTMDNLENDDAAEYYSIEDVPYVQYFSNAVGLHAAFWHNKFGFVRSHCCVNLAPRDAQWLFAFTAPHLPAGWTAVFPDDLEPSTAVRVR